MSKNLVLKENEICSTVFLRRCIIAPRKMRSVARLLSGKSIDESLNLLSYLEKKCVVFFEKLLLSAFSSLERKCVDSDGNVRFLISKGNVFVKAIWVDSSGCLKRFRAGSRGRPSTIRKKFSSVTLVVVSFVEKKDKDGAKV